MSSDKLVSMANQIATFFHSQPGADRAQRVADHLNDFWDPRMRRDLIAHVAAGGAGLDPLVQEAMSHLRAPAG
ncbi:formate dehydrogenase subunit delta [Mesobacterium sp. TK19101]|uniref:Formate dehydrogenase subunit delta n=1 Tax=Mesobacterium hydrothermale TaxID=3111907 RepID=A0ABU6HHX3_9RHOB|nr:formate dehydrogenase subunit delta [Mesobacterium sp. TK19101]MEC3861702.1 formate dehydrogenase subunit delta [Mesobacterium sp. TK19101]